MARNGLVDVGGSVLAYSQPTELWTGKLGHLCFLQFRGGSEHHMKLVHFSSVLQYRVCQPFLKKAEGTRNTFDLSRVVLGG